MPFRLGPYLAESTIGMGALGAIIGGTNAIAKNVEQVRTGKITEAEAVKDIGKEALKNGVVTAATFVTVASFGGELILSVGLTLVIGSTLKYAWDRSYDSINDKNKVQSAAKNKKKGQIVEDNPKNMFSSNNRFLSQKSL